MEKNQIMEQVEKLPTLVNKLRFVDENFPTDNDVLKKAYQKALTLSLKRQFPLFAKQIKPSEPRELSGAETYIAIAYQMLHINHYSDVIIESYSSNPVVSYALQKPRPHISERFNKDRKNWEENAHMYAGLVGSRKLKKSPIPKISRKIRWLFMGQGFDPSMAKKTFTKRESKHPIAYLDKKLFQFHQRKENTEFRKKKE